MARVESLVSITVQAGGDLSAGQFRFVEIATDGQVDLVSAAGGNAIGVLMDKPNAAGRAAQVAVNGVAKVVAGTGGVTAGDEVQSDGSGEAIAAAAGDKVLGRALTTAAAGELAEILLQSKHLNA